MGQIMGRSSNCRSAKPGWAQNPAECSGVIPGLLVEGLSAGYLQADFGELRAA